MAQSPVSAIEMPDLDTFASRLTKHSDQLTSWMDMVKDSEGMFQPVGVKPYMANMKDSLQEMEAHMNTMAQETDVDFSLPVLGTFKFSESLENFSAQLQDWIGMMEEGKFKFRLHGGKPESGELEQSVQKIRIYVADIKKKVDATYQTCETIWGPEEGLHKPKRHSTREQSEVRLTRKAEAVRNVTFEQSPKAPEQDSVVPTVPKAAVPGISRMIAGHKEMVQVDRLKTAYEERLDRVTGDLTSAEKSLVAGRRDRKTEIDLWKSAANGYKPRAEKAEAEAAEFLADASSWKDQAEELQDPFGEQTANNKDLQEENERLDSRLRTVTKDVDVWQTKATTLQGELDELRAKASEAQTVLDGKVKAIRVLELDMLGGQRTLSVDAEVSSRKRPSVSDTLPGSLSRVKVSLGNATDDVSGARKNPLLDFGSENIVAVAGDSLSRSAGGRNPLTDLVNGVSGATGNFSVDPNFLDGVQISPSTPEARLPPGSDADWMWMLAGEDDTTSNPPVLPCPIPSCQ